MNHFVQHALERLKTVEGFEKVRFIILYDVAYRTIREFDDFKHRLYDYIGKEAMA